MFALLLTLPVAIVVTWVLRPGSSADKRLRSTVALGTLLWIAGLGIDLYNPSATVQLVTAGHAIALLGGLALVGAGLMAGPLRPRTRRERREARG
jgi:hypothetical protein